MNRLPLFDSVAWPDNDYFGLEYASGKGLRDKVGFWTMYLVHLGLPDMRDGVPWDGKNDGV